MNRGTNKSTSVLLYKFEFSVNFIVTFMEHYYWISLRTLWNVSQRTHCDIITVRSDQLPLIITLQRRFINSNNKSLDCCNQIVKLFLNMLLVTL